MADPLTPARFAELADAFGGVIARWPEDVRAEATILAAQPAMQSILAQAEWLDTQLDAWDLPAPSPSLRSRIVATRRSPLSRRARIWWSSLGIAAAVTGAAAGSIAVAAVLPPAHAIPDEATAFGDFVQEN